MSAELLQRYRCDRDRRDYERLVEMHRPLVASVCRRLLRDPNDVDDVVQETFLKLAGSLDTVSGSLAGWLVATARAASVDLIRREVRERNRRRALAHVAPTQVEYPAAREAIRLKLHDAMQILEPSARQVITERFLHKRPLGTLAHQLEISVPTAHRRVAASVQQLAEVLRGMGVAQADDRIVSEQLGQSPVRDEWERRDHGDLRFAPDWRCAELTPLGETATGSLLPGWSRPIRVGALLGYQSTVTAGIGGLRMHLWQQVESTLLFPQMGIHLVAVVEPGSVHRGVVECTLRDFGILGGLIEADDAAALQTLDVLLIGVNFSISPSTAKAFNEAARGGVGLLNEYWAGSIIGVCDDRNLLDLMLADSPCYAYHMPGRCGEPARATVLREHPLLSGLHAGMTMTVAGCGPAYRIVPGAQLVISKDYLVEPSRHGIAGIGALPMPCYIVGGLGRGRVVVNHVWPTKNPTVAQRAAYQVTRHLNVGREDYFVTLLKWLAASKRE